MDIQEYEEALPSEGSVEDDIIHSEELARVRRGLAFIRSDYRHILVAALPEYIRLKEEISIPDEMPSLLHCITDGAGGSERGMRVPTDF